MDDTTTTAIADLRLFFSTAADLYRSHVRLVEVRDWAQAIESLAQERTRDSALLTAAALDEGVLLPDSEVDISIVRQELSFGRAPPVRPAQAIFRIQRAESLLGHLTDHLIPAVRPGPVRTALQTILRGVRARQPLLRELRDTTRPWEFGKKIEVAFGGLRDASPPDTQGEALTVWFGTNRARAGRGWSGRASETVRFGQCSVFVPNNRQIGSLGPVAMFGGEAVKLKGTTLLDENEFWADLSAACAGLDRSVRHALVFLHGYNTSFEKAARRTAQLKADLQHQGPAAFFSWPSADRMLGYASDKAAIEGSEHAIREFLVDFVRRAGAEQVHIIAHSMGNVGLLRAIDTIAKDAAAHTGVKFGQIVLAAPDVDTKLFRNLARAYQQLAARTTLYVAENDRVLGGSSWLHGTYARAGLAPPVVIVSGVDTVNVSQINLGLLGHGYGVGLDKVLGDIHALLRNDSPPDRRFRLRSVGAAANAHWEFKP